MSKIIMFNNKKSKQIIKYKNKVEIKSKNNHKKIILRNKLKKKNLRDKL